MDIVNKAFERWKNEYVKENENIDFDLIILEDMAAAWNASRIDTLDEMLNKLQYLSPADNLDVAGICIDIKTELEKARE